MMEITSPSTSQRVSVQVQACALPIHLDAALGVMAGEIMDIYM
ncbi:hypothetical protein [Sorlinia euscelidii]